MNSALILLSKFTLWIPHLSTLHAAKGKQILLLNRKSSPVAGSALSMALVLDPKVWWVWDLVQAYVLKRPLANQSASSSEWQIPMSSWLCPFKGTDTTNLSCAPLLGFPHSPLQLCTLSLVSCRVTSEVSRMFSGKSSTRKQWYLRYLQQGWPSSSMDLSLGATLQPSTKFSTTTAHGGDPTTARICLCSCKHLCCKIWLKDKCLCVPSLLGSTVRIEGFFSDLVTAPGLARLTLGFWECLSLEALKFKSPKFYEPEKHKVHWVLTLWAQFACFPNKPSLSRPRNQHEVCKCGQFDGFISDEQS